MVFLDLAVMKRSDMSDLAKMQSPNISCTSCVTVVRSPLAIVIAC